MRSGGGHRGQDRHEVSEAATRPAERRLRAVVWDFDGTLVDTSRRNLSVTRRIVEVVTGRAYVEWPALASLAAYETALKEATNWRDFYQSAFGLGEGQTDGAGALWTEYQLRDPTPAPVYDGIARVLERLSDVPHGIVSQNSHAYITALLERERLARHFSCIVGYEEVELSRQKPEPDGLLLCLERLTGFAEGVVLYVGDHRADTLCARRADRILSERHPSVRVRSVGAFYGSHEGDAGWTVKPDYRVEAPLDLVPIAAALR